MRARLRRGELADLAQRLRIIETDAVADLVDGNETVAACHIATGV
jgi:hypothetical protein